MAIGEKLYASMGEAMRDAMDHQRAGQLNQAERLYRAILADDPAHAAAAYNLALIKVRTGRAREALPVLKAAFDADRANEAALVNYAVALAGSGQAGSAQAVLLEAKQRGQGGAALEATLVQIAGLLGLPGDTTHPAGRKGHPAEPPAPSLTALVNLFNAKMHTELEAEALRMCERYPQSTRLMHLLGASRLARGLNAEALDVLLKANQLAAADAGILNLLGVALFRLGRHGEASLRFQQGLATEPRSYETLVNAAANALAAGDIGGGQRFAEQALQIRANGVEAMLNLANALVAARRSSEAVELLRRAIAVEPNSAVLYMNLGNLLTSIGKADDAVVALREAVRRRPDLAPAHLNLGRALHDQGEVLLAKQHFRAASDLDASLAAAHSAYLCALVHDATVSPQHVFEEHLRIGDLLEAPYRGAWREHRNDRDPERELRLGFVSGDLREHPVSNLIEPVWRALRGGRHRLIAYSNGRSGDDAEVRLRALAHEWVEVDRMSDNDLAERIRQDGIDILFDLSGHTAGNRLPVFARKPAPIQVSWIGYPGTTGLSAMDYRFRRSISSSGNAAQAQFREKLVHLGAPSFEPALDAPMVNALPACGNGYLTFGGFARPSKLGEGVIALWSRVLRAIPDARLIMAGIDEASTKQKLLSAFAVHGVAERRITIHPRLPTDKYLALHCEVDIILDTFPYAGGTTTYHAVWMGVPVLTLAGPSPPQNQAAGLLVLVGLSNWIAPHEDGFVEQACRAARDLPALARLRVGLRAAAERYCQGATGETAQELELALRTIWRRWCSGGEPVSFSCRADRLLETFPEASTAR